MRLQILIDAYVRLNEMHTQPGDKCHMLACSIAYVQKKITEELRQSPDSPAMFTYITETTNKMKESE